MVKTAFNLRNESFLLIQHLYIETNLAYNYNNKEAKQK